MPRKAFVADLHEATELTTSGHKLDIRAGEDDGTFTFAYKPPGSEATSVTINAHISDVGDYPSAHQYFIYTDSENVPPELAKALSNIDGFSGLKVSQMISKATELLDKATAGSRYHPVYIDDDSMDVDSPSEPEDSEQESQDLDEGTESDDFFEEHLIQAVPWPSREHTHQTAGRQANSKASQETRARIKSDLRAIKEAGFHVGHFGQILEGQSGFLILSIRISKLDIPEDALRAWHMDEKLYLMLLIRYQDGYKPLEELLTERAAQRRQTTSMKMHVGVCSQQKISFSEANDTFNRQGEGKWEKTFPKATQADGETRKVSGDVQPQDEAGIGNLFIDRPLNELLNDRLLEILRYRLRLAISWGGAEAYYNDIQGRSLIERDAIDSKYWAESASDSAIHLPDVVTSDHLSANPKPHSFPLLAMQFLLRHLVRCTEFCLVCHCSIDAQWEALMPYVCDKPLCLYQYMALGFGPSIEHEILIQPYVVDLLLSFCYAAASASSLKDSPVGMGLMVPHPALIPGGMVTSQYRRKYQFSYPDDPGDEISLENSTSAMAKTYNALWDTTHEELVFPKDLKPLKVGDWVCLLPIGKSEVKQHRKVVEAWYPNVRLGPAVVVSRNAAADHDQYLATRGLRAPHREPTPMVTPSATPPSYSSSAKAPPGQVEFVIYDQNFDDLTKTEQLSSLRMLLDTLPSVLEMRSHLQDKSAKHMILGALRDRLSPAAVGVLHWVIASNRSCIVQIDSLDRNEGRAEERVSGMQSYMQFRFAQGAPDKEQRFITSVRDVKARLNLKYPTIFAWHGSYLQNWHGIIREGLHFKQTLHGRAFGNGVYFAPDISTSLGYSRGVEDLTHIGWPRSELKISQAICLNEIINAPAEFVSHKPHLVVAQLDWIQTRYLFVKCNAIATPTIEDNVPIKALEQDPKFFPKGPDGQMIIIPIAAAGKARQPSIVALKNGNKKTKLLSDELDDGYLVSDDTDTEDERILLDEGTGSSTDSEPKHAKLAKKSPLRELSSKSGAKKSLATFVGGMIPKKKSEADFIPRTLDYSTLPMLAPPTYATSMATKALQRELSATIKIQETHLAHELGWYLDAEAITNVYQWIVEMHSFDPTLPLAKDMKAKKVKSIVLELRFGKGFPYSPPFVRVVRPRFLPFMMGGGGHVTAGGALCMELLTNDGWNPASTIEAVLLQVRLAMSSTDPKPARLETWATVRDYSVGEAVEAFRRACLVHGWKVPDDLKLIGQGDEQLF